MKRLNTCIVYIAGMTVATGCLLNAQTAPSNPLSTEAQQAWTRTMNNAIAAAAKMPEDDYGYKPSPESMSFRDIVAHVADSAMGACTGLNGERKTAGAAQMKTKAELAGALQEAKTACETTYTPNDTKAVEMITGGRGGARSRLSTLWGNTAHIEHEYAQMAVLLRLKGLVPPSSEGRGGRGGR